MSKKISFEQWIELTDKEREKIQEDWNVYWGHGEEIANNIVELFIEKYKSIPNLIVEKKAINRNGKWIINIKHPFIFDRRKIPKIFLGIDVYGSIPTSNLPQEFQKNERKHPYVWAPENFENFVDNNLVLIKKELENDSMTREEALDALCFGDFKKHVGQCSKWKKEGKI